jgi:hypothetical protein
MPYVAKPKIVVCFLIPTSSINDARNQSENGKPAARVYAGRFEMTTWDRTGRL